MPVLKRKILHCLTLSILVVAHIQGCAPADIEPSVIIISLDGFRWDYLEKYDTPNLKRIADTGVRARGLIPVFPTKTFPNHYSMVTGLYPESHGIVGNRMVDADLKPDFRPSNREAVEDGRWWGGEPIWAAVNRNGRKSATFFWPGSEAEITGQRPTYWRRYDSEVSHRERIEQLLAWLDLPPTDRPAFVASYFASVDLVGHKFGLDSAELRDTVQRLDRTVGQLITGLESRDLLSRVNLIIVSDHGMTPVNPKRLIFLDDYVDLNTVFVVEWSPVLLIQPKRGRQDRVFEALRNAHPHLSVFLKAQVPDRLHFSKHPRIPDIVGIVDEGWTLTSRAFYAERGLQNRATHGYDNRLESMQGIFIAHGPALQRGMVVEPFESLHIYALLAELLGIRPAPNESDPEVIRPMLAP